MKIYILELISSDLNDDPKKQYRSGIIDVFKTKNEAQKKIDELIKSNEMFDGICNIFEYELK